jgi:hypothetical protein
MRAAGVVSGAVVAVVAVLVAPGDARAAESREDEAAREAWAWFSTSESGAANSLLGSAVAHSAFGIWDKRTKEGARLSVTFDAASGEYVAGGGEKAAGETYEARINAQTGAVTAKRLDAASGVTLTPIEAAPRTRANSHDGAIVFSVTSDIAVVATPRARGIKEDIVVTRALEDQITLSWDLALGDGLEARLERGDVNIYGPSDFLSGDGFAHKGQVAHKVGDLPIKSFAYSALPSRKRFNSPR